VKLPKLKLSNFEISMIEAFNIETIPKLKPSNFEIFKIETFNIGTFKIELGKIVTFQNLNFPNWNFQI